jgi:hypothetical protein
MEYFVDAHEETAQADVAYCGFGCSFLVFSSTDQNLVHIVYVCPNFHPLHGSYQCIM